MDSYLMEIVLFIFYLLVILLFAFVIRWIRIIKNNSNINIQQNKIIISLLEENSKNKV